MIKINLLPYREQRKKQAIIDQAMIAGASCLPFIIGIIISFFLINAKVGHVSDEIEKTNREIKKQSVSIEKINDFKTKKATLEKKMNIIENLPKGKSGPVHIIDELTVNLPGRLWLSSLKEKNMNLELEGIAFDNLAVSNYMVNLEKSSYFKNVDLVKISTSKQKGQNELGLKSFTLSCQISFDAK
jgi:type IV pilus assembly protein PilN